MHIKEFSNIMIGLVVVIDFGFYTSQTATPLMSGICPNLGGKNLEFDQIWKTPSLKCEKNQYIMSTHLGFDQILAFPSKLHPPSH